jgi:hypothetical protein
MRHMRSRAKTYEAHEATGGREEGNMAIFYDPWGAMISLWWMFSHIIPKIRREK